MTSSMVSLFIEMAHGQVPRTNLFRKEPTTSVPVATAPVKEAPLVPRPTQKASQSAGNLPWFYFGRSFGLARFSESPVFLPATPKKTQHSGLPLGAVVDAEILESIVAFTDSKVPVRAVVRSGLLKDTIFLGEATLERNSKRIMIEFRKLRGAQKNDVYSTIANAMDATGLLGLEGEHNSGEAKYFGAEFLAAGAAGYADASVERNQNALGQVIETASVANATKKAFSNALMRTADRFAEKIRTAPEYAIARGPLRIQILIQEQPKLQE